MLEKNYRDKLIDFHTHMDQRVLKESRVMMVCNVGSKKEYQEFVEWKRGGRTEDCYSIGVHPWKALTISIEEIKPYLNEAVCIGEIGMDNVWCDVELEIQEKVFREQLKIAIDIDKSVVLHTKGMEKEIAEIIKEYPNTYIIHWFDEPKYIKNYVELDCYFTIGPSILKQKRIKTMIQQIPIDRILVETDGIQAMEWLYNKQLSIEEYYRLLEETYLFLAKFYQLSLDDFKLQLHVNIHNVFHR